MTKITSLTIDIFNASKKHIKQIRKAVIKDPALFCLRKDTSVRVIGKNALSDKPRIIIKSNQNSSDRTLKWIMVIMKKWTSNRTIINITHESRTYLRSK